MTDAFPSPGKTGGPCRREYCGHASCDRTRALARQLCTICSEPIGFDAGYVDDTSEEEFAPPVLTHAICAAAAAANFEPPF